MGILLLLGFMSYFGHFSNFNLSSRSLVISVPLLIFSCRIYAVTQYTSLPRAVTRASSLVPSSHFFYCPTNLISVLSSLLLDCLLLALATATLLLYVPSRSLLLFLFGNLASDCLPTLELATKSFLLPFPSGHFFPASTFLPSYNECFELLSTQGIILREYAR